MRCVRSRCVLSARAGCDQAAVSELDQTKGSLAAERREKEELQQKLAAAERRQVRAAVWTSVLFGADIDIVGCCRVLTYDVWTRSRC